MQPAADADLEGERCLGAYVVVQHAAAVGGERIELGVRPQVAQTGAHHAFGACRRCVQRAPDDVEQLVGLLLVNREQHLFPRLEVQVHRAFCEARLARHQFHRTRLRRLAMREQAFGGAHDGVAALRLVLRRARPAQRTSQLAA